MSTKNRLLLVGGIILAVLIALIVRSKAVLNSGTGAGSIATAYSVSIATVQTATVDESISSVGTLNAINDVVVLSETQGRILKVDCEVGDYKKAGSVLVEVDSELKEAAYKAAQVTYRKSKKRPGAVRSAFNRTFNIRHPDRTGAMVVSDGGGAVYHSSSTAQRHKNYHPHLRDRDGPLCE